MVSTTPFCFTGLLKLVVSESVDPFVLAPPQLFLALKRGTTRV